MGADQRRTRGRHWPQRNRAHKNVSEGTVLARAKRDGWTEQIAAAKLIERPPFFGPLVSKSRRLGYGSTDRNRAWVRRSSVRAGPTPSPIAESITSSRCRANRKDRSTVFPSTSGTNRATSSSTHSQVILCGKCRRVGLVGGSYSMRDFSVIAPTFPDILNARSTCLRRGCRNRVSRTLGPGKCLRCTISSPINRETRSNRISLNSHLNWILTEGSGLCNRSVHRN